MSVVFYWNQICAVYNQANEYLTNQINYVLPQMNEFIMILNVYVSFMTTWFWIKFVNWLDVTGIEDTDDSHYKWVVYTHLGQRYRVLVPKPRGPSSTIDETLQDHYGDSYYEILGPWGNFHGQQDLLRSLIQVD